MDISDITFPLQIKKYFKNVPSKPMPHVHNVRFKIIEQGKQKLDFSREAYISELEKNLELRKVIT